MFCTQCGESIEAGDKFCWNCGAAAPKRRAGASVGAKPSTSAGETLNVSSTVDMQQRVTHAASREAQSPAQSFSGQPKPEIVAPQGTAAAARPQLVFDRPSTPSRVPQEWNAPELRDGSSPESVQESPRAAVHDAVSPSPWLDAVPQASAAAQPAAAPAVPPSPAPKPSRPVVHQEVLYDSVGNEITPDDSSELSLGPADIPTPSFGGYASPTTATRSQLPNANTAPKRSRPSTVVNSAPPSAEVAIRKRKPVLEIIVAVFLLLGAGVAVWMLHASLPAKSTAPASAISVTLSPTSADVTAGRAADFAAIVTGTDDDRVSWTVQEGEDGGRVVTHGTKTVDGQESSTAVYIAPNNPGVYHLVVASVADPQKSASAEINVVRR